jgi:type 1 glutamine amidotransferase
LKPKCAAKEQTKDCERNQEMRALVLCDDRYHPAQIPRAGIGALGACGFEFDWMETAAQWSAERMGSYPLVLLAKINNCSAEDHAPWLDESVQRAFVDYVRRGGGLFAIHGGTAGVLDLPAMRQLLGGAFLKHPPQCPVTVQPKPEHPLCAESSAFTLRDEHYQMALDDPEADVYLTTASEHGEQPGGWTRREGAGRVCVLTPGHTLEVWLHPSYQALLRSGLRWCSGQA